MTLEDIITKEKLDDVTIYYRTFVNLPDEGEIDIFTGGCKLENGQLISLDGDTYNFDDVIIKYLVFRGTSNNSMMVWY